MYKCNKCGFNDCYLTILKTKKGNLQVMVCKDCGDIMSFITNSPCTERPTSNINKLAQSIHENAQAHGWWDSERSGAEIIALCHAELSEALEEMRKGMKPVYYPHLVDGGYDPKPSKAEGWAVEMIDCVIRIFDYLAGKNINIETVITEKHEYNKTRPYKHGKRF